jgi:periplasmic protein TonB
MLVFWGPAEAPRVVPMAIGFEMVHLDESASSTGAANELAEQAEVEAPPEPPPVEETLEPEPEPTPPEPEPIPEPEPTPPEPEPIPEPEPTPPEPEPIPEPEPTPPEPEPIPEPEPAPPEPEPTPEPDPKPEPKATPAPPPAETPSDNADRSPDPDVRLEPAAAQEPAGVQSDLAEEFTPPSSGAAYLNNPKPVYPAAARRRGMEGVVRLEVEVSADGRPLAVAVKESSGFRVLDVAAREAVEHWRFEPARRMGRAVAATVEVPIRFELK